MAIGIAGAPGAPAPTGSAEPSTSSRPSPHGVDGRQRRSRRRRWRPNTLPYLLIAPAVAALVVMLGYPLLRLGILSVQKFGLRQQFGQPPEWVGTENYRRILADSYFWDVLWRTVTFAMVNVALTIGLGLLIALLMRSLGRAMRLLVSIGLMLAWAMPALTATVVWQWLFDTQYGLVNWFFTTLGIGDYRGHSWLSEPISFSRIAATFSRSSRRARARRAGSTSSPITESAPAARIPVTSAKVVVAKAATTAPRPSAPTCSSAAPARVSRTVSPRRCASAAWS